jgi:hypothetical protein
MCRVDYEGVFSAADHTVPVQIRKNLIPLNLKRLNLLPHNRLKGIVNRSKLAESVAALLASRHWSSDRRALGNN